MANMRITTPCEVCGEPVYAKPSHRAKGRGRFCSMLCKNRARVGTFATRLEAEIDRSDTIGCWPCPGLINQSTGYGIISIGGKRIGTHVLAWLVASDEPIPDGMFVCHVCDNPPCCRADDLGTHRVNGIDYERRGHLFLAPHAINIADAAQKNRMASGDHNGSRLYPERLRRGEAVAIAVLTAPKALEIKREYARGGIRQVDLAQKYNTTQGTISKVIRGVTWKHVP